MVKGTCKVMTNMGLGKVKLSTCYIHSQNFNTYTIILLFWSNNDVVFKDTIKITLETCAFMREFTLYMC